LNALQKYEYNSYKSYFINTSETTSDTKVDVDSYRNVVTSPYQVVSGSFSGKLCLIMKLRTIDSFSINYSSKLFIDE
jgi:hypothetical protein